MNNLLLKSSNTFLTNTFACILCCAHTGSLMPRLYEHDAKLGVYPQCHTPFVQICVRTHVQSFTPSQVYCSKGTGKPTGSAPQTS